MKRPHVTRAALDWSAALIEVERHAGLQLAATAQPQTRSDAGLTVSDAALARLNAAMEQRFPGIAASPLPVLLPVDVEAVLRDRAAGIPLRDDADRFAGFRPTAFFLSGPAGYDAAFTLHVGDVAEFSDVKFSGPIEVQISGSTLLYEVEGSAVAAGTPVPTLDDAFPGIRRLIHEHRLRYTFVRYGAPYAVSIACFDGRVSRYRMPPCRIADRIAVRFLHALRVAGGMPRPQQPSQPPAIERPADQSAVFRYHAPGRLLPGTGFRRHGGRIDRTVYARIRFPLAHAPAYVNTQMFQRRSPSPAFGYPWQDNFCERRGFPVGQCPAGVGHQGQDIRPAACWPRPCRPHDQVVAVRDGTILRWPRQEAVYLFVNAENEHIRFRYLHMNPRQMDADGLLSGRRVREGEVIGEISNFSRRENGTTYHLHFDVQVPTKDGWIFVNPYMTLVASYEQLIGRRGVEIEEAAPDMLVADRDRTPAAHASKKRLKPHKTKRVRHAKHRGHKVGKVKKAKKKKKRGKERLARR